MQPAPGDVTRPAKGAIPPEVKLQAQAAGVQEAAAPLEEETSRWMSSGSPALSSGPRRSFLGVQGSLARPSLVRGAQ